MNKESVSPTNVWDSKLYGFSQGIVVEGKRMLFIAGQNGLDKDARIVGKDFESQCRQSFENIGAILSSAGADFHNVVKVTGYLTDMKNLEAFVKISSNYFKDDLPTQTLLEVKSLALPDLNVEVEAIAVL